jgi:HK97 family phage major capsid protein
MQIWHELAKMKKQRAELNAEIEGLTAKDGVLTPAEKSRVEIIGVEMGKLNRAIMDREKIMDEVTNGPTLLVEPNILGGSGVDKNGNFTGWHWPDGRVTQDEAGKIPFTGGQSDRPRGRTHKTWASLFGGRIPAAGGDSDAQAETFYRALTTGMVTPEIVAMNEGSGSAGGFLVPDELISRVMGPAYDSSIILPRATTFRMTGETLSVAGLNASSAESGVLFGGATFQWIPETGTISPTDPTLAKVKFHARTLAILSKASNELSEDSPIGQQIEQAMIMGAPQALDYAFLRGTGAGQPRGILNDPALIAVAKEATQDPDTIWYENIVKMFSRLHPSCVANSVWLAHPSTIPQLSALSVVIGVGGTYIPAMNNTDGRFTLLTRPVIFTELLPVLGDQGDIVLVDLTQYGVALRKDLTIEKSGHVYFTSNQTAWRGLVRCDGMGLWPSAYTPRNGSTLSWCVALAERA